MKKTSLFSLAALLMLITAVVFTGCKKDTPAPPTITGDALFSFVADGLTVTFTNESDVTPPVTYLWDFGDTETSTEKDPVHTYAAKGEYTVKLTVTDQNGGKHDVSTKITVDRKGRIKLDDGTLDDWNVVTEDQFVVPLGDNAGAVVSAKYEYDADFVYAYIEFAGTLTDEFQYDVFMDFDNDSTTGFKSYLWPASGADYLVEIAPITDAAVVPGAFNYIGEPGVEDWNWEEKQLAAGSIVIGTMKQVGDNIAVELGFSRSAVGDGSLNNDVVSFGAFVSNSDWAEIGYAPDATQEGGVHTSYFKFEMK